MRAFRSALCILAACGTPAGTVDAPVGDAPRGDAPRDGGAGKRIVILMIGDGMGREHVAAASEFAHGTVGQLAMESLPVRGTVITSGPSGTTDSAAAATTMATGVRTYNGAIGLDRDGAPIETVVELAHRIGLPAGLVSTAAVPHATPGAFSAHRDSRHDLTEIADDQARLVHPDVLLGGGLQYYLAAGPDSVRTDDGLLDDLAAAGYTVARTTGELAAAPVGPVAGLFAAEHMAYSVERPPASTEPTLTEMSLSALERLDAGPDGFFLMIEGARIDMAAHGNLLSELIGDTVAFDDTVRAVAAWAESRDDVTLIVTADHECGGLQIVQSNGAGVLPDVTWRWGQHTNAPVDVFARGPGSSVLAGDALDHRWIHAVIASRLTGAPFEPPAPDRIPDGRLTDVPHVAATQGVISGFGPGRNQLDALHLAADDRALAIGVAGVFERGQNAVVVLLDVDFGASTGPARLEGALTDTTGRIDGILAASSLDAPTVAGFGIDLAIAAWGGEDPWIEQTIADAGLRGLRAPYGQPGDLGWYGIASNFGDGIKTDPEPAPPTVPIPGRGWEVHVPWATLYPDGIPAGATLAIAAVLVNDDGGYTSNQALPSFPPGTANPGRVITALPGVVVFTADADGDGAPDPITSSTVLP
jgi:alkaline phosphatase